MEAVMMREDLKCAEEAGVQALESLYTVRDCLLYTSDAADE